MLVIEVSRPDLKEEEFIAELDSIHNAIDEYFIEKSIGCTHEEIYLGLDAKLYCSKCLVAVTRGGK